MFNLYRHLPHCCPLCHAPASAYLCSGCEQDLPRLDDCCQMCAMPMPEREAARSLCGDCLNHKKPFSVAVCCYLYGYPLDRLLQHFKRKDPYSGARYFVPLLAAMIAQRYSDDRLPDALVPVPIHWARRLTRGHNQTEVLAASLAPALDRPWRDFVRKCTHSAAQKTLDRRARLANLRGTFACTGEVQGRHLAIVDDVITTGATATRMSECLLQAGAIRVDVWALARTP